MSTTPPPATAIWLLPSADDSRRLTSIIGDLAACHGSPRFEPHLTVLGGLRIARSRIETLMRRIAERTASMDLPVLGVRHSAAFFRSVVLGIEDDPKLRALRGAFCDGLGHGLSDPPAPHVSLLYGELPDDVRQSLTDKVDAGGVLCFDRLAIASPRPGALDWLDVEHWRLLAVHELRRPIVSSASGRGSR